MALSLWMGLFLSMNYNHILRYARKVTRDEDLAKDIVHELYLRLHKQGVNMLDDSKPKNFIWSALNRTSIDYYRKYVSPKYVVRYHPIEPLWKYTIQEDDELVAIDQRPNELDLVISRETVNLCRENIKLGYQRDMPRKPISLFMDIFESYLQGYYTNEIAKKYNVSQQYINNYKTRIKEWIKPILKA